MMQGEASAVHVRPVRSKADGRAFLEVPYRLYKGHAHWVPPLRSDAAAGWDTQKNPFYAHAEIERFIAVRGGESVGRIAAIHNRAHNEFHNEPVGFFGFFETVDEPPITRALLDAVATWHRERGLSILRGPVNPSMGSECGLLVEGFDEPPVIMMPYNPPYYRDHLEACGLTKEVDLVAFDVHRDPGESAGVAESRQRLAGLVDRLAKRHPDLSIRKLDMKHLRRDAFVLRDVFDGARRDNYGFVPSTEAEYEALVGKLEQIVDPDIVSILEKSGHPVGCVVALPDWNLALKRSERWPGPLRLLKILAEKKRIDAIRVLAIAVAPEYRRSGILSWLIQSVIENGLPKGYRRAELSWIAETNTVQMQTLGKLFGNDPYKRYRIFSGSIESDH